MSKILMLTALTAASLGVAPPAHAGELFGGVYAHAVNTPLSRWRMMLARSAAMWSWVTMMTVLLRRSFSDSIRSRISRRN